MLHQLLTDIEGDFSHVLQESAIADTGTGEYIFLRIQSAHNIQGEIKNIAKYAETANCQVNSCELVLDTHIVPDILEWQMIIYENKD